jgi:hypothetical protein
MDRHYIVVTPTGNSVEHTGPYDVAKFVTLAHDADLKQMKADSTLVGYRVVYESDFLFVWQRKGFIIDACGECPEFMERYDRYGDSDHGCGAGTDMSTHYFVNLAIHPDCNRLGAEVTLYWPRTLEAE